METALVLPIFLFAMVMVLYFFWVMQIQYVVGNSLDRAVAESSLVKEISPTKAENLTKASFYKELVRQKCSLSRITKGIGGFSWKNTKVDEEYIDALVTYRVKWPIRFFGKTEIKLSDGCRMHRWTGNQDEEGGKKYQEWVYITPTESVYHLSRGCTHLKLSIKSAASERLKTDLKQYAPCGHCTDQKKKGAVIYITEEGTCYHVKIDCSGLKRTVYMILKSQAGNRNPCSRCGGK
ncbi:MAG: pilus assembly protein [Lachnospiraceae bacterium]|nr:pilus assembly protein [Lachnospiraceae bacterium]